MMKINSCRTYKHKARTHVEALILPHILINFIVFFFVILLLLILILLFYSHSFFSSIFSIFSIFFSLSLYLVFFHSLSLFSVSTLPFLHFLYIFNHSIFTTSFTTSFPNSTSFFSRLKARITAKRIYNTKNYSNSLQFVFFPTWFSVPTG